MSTEPTGHQVEVPQEYDPFDDEAQACSAIEKTIQKWAQNVNDRLLDFDKPEWRDISPSFTIDRPILSIPVNSTTLDFRGILKSMEVLISENPEYHVRVTGIDVTLDRKARKAMVWVNQIITGHPKGVTRHLTGLATFRYDDERWIMVHFETPIGMTGSPGFDRMVGGLYANTS